MIIDIFPLFVNHLWLSTTATRIARSLCSIGFNQVRKITMTSNQTWVVKYKLPGDQVRTPREIIVTAISQSDAKKVAQAMIPSAIILGGPQPVR